jgi:hypothetical protein
MVSRIRDAVASNFCVVSDATTAVVGRSATIGATEHLMMVTRRCSRGNASRERIGESPKKE